MEKINNDKSSRTNHGSSKGRFFVIIAAVLLLGGVYALYTTSVNQNKNTQMPVKETSVTTENQLAKQNDTTTTSYRDYNEEAVVQSLAEGKKVALFFYAAWCPTCRNLDKEIKNQVASLPADFIIYKVNYDRSSDLKQKYGVTTQHTIVFIDKDMNLVDKIIGANFDEIITK